MRRVALGLTWLAGLVVLLGSGLAVAQEDGPGGEGPRRPRRGPEGRPDGPRQDGPRRPGGPLGADTPEIREEMQRHTAAMRQLMQALRPQDGGLREKIRELREQGATREEISKALKPDPAKAAEAAGGLADELATHYTNLAKIITENRDAVAKSIAENLAKRAATRGGPGRGGPDGEGFRPRGGPGGEGGAPPPPRRRRREAEDDPAPENF